MPKNPIYFRTEEKQELTEDFQATGILYTWKKEPVSAVASLSLILPLPCFLCLWFSRGAAGVSRSGFALWLLCFLAPFPYNMGRKVLDDDENLLGKMKIPSPIS